MMMMMTITANYNTMGLLLLAEHSNDDDCVEDDDDGIDDDDDDDEMIMMMVKIGNDDYGEVPIANCSSMDRCCCWPSIQVPLLCICICICICICTHNGPAGVTPSQPSLFTVSASDICVCL